LVLSLVILPVGLGLKDTSNTNLINKKPPFLSIFLSLTFFFFFFTPFISLAENVVDELQTKINQYTQKIIELGQAKKTLKNEISYIESQIYLTALQITQTENSIDVLKRDIAELSLKISQLDITLNQLSRAFIIQTTQSYKLQKTLSPLIAFVSGDFNQFLKQQKYLTVVQKNSQDTLVNMETVRTNYDLQKQRKAQKQAELETLQAKLDQQKLQLASQKQSKNHLLEVTQNDETSYQNLKKEAERELSSLLAAKFVGKRQVAKGEALGMMGNTGYSFGDHLHFGLYQLSESDLNSWSYRNDIDPMPYINSHQWPMNEPIRITQSRGQTQYSYLYSDRFHHGIDMVSTNKTITAINEGMAYFFRNPASSLGNHIKLFHPDGYMTLYLHMQ